MKKFSKKFLTMACVCLCLLCVSGFKTLAFSPTDGALIKYANQGEQLKAIDSTPGWWLVSEKDKLGWVNAGPTSYWDSNKSNFPIYLKANKRIPINEGNIIYTYSNNERIHAFSSVSGWWKVVTPQGKIAWVNAGPTKYDRNGLLMASSSLKAYASPMQGFSSGNATKVVDQVINKLGIPYVWGGTTPAGFDCSGLVKYVYGECGYSLSRSTYTQVNEGSAVSKNNLLPGDLVFFGSGPDHVGIYIGNDKFVHAPTQGEVVKISVLSSRGDFSCARRIIK